MYSRSKDGTYTPYSVESIRSSSEVWDSTEEFKGMALLLEGIISRSVAEDSDILGNSVDLDSVVSACNSLACYLE